MTELVKTDLCDGVLQVCMNRPDKKNALLHVMYTAMADAIARAETDPAVRVLLFCGAGNAFTAGNDMEDFLSSKPDGDSAVDRFLFALAHTDVPVVMAVHGVAVGVGTTMLLHADQVLADTSARFAMPFINLAVVPEAGSTQLLVNLCGYQKAAELLMLGEMFDAQQALAYGIVGSVTEPEQLMARATEQALKLAAKPRRALRATKRLLRRDHEPLQQRMRLELQQFIECMETPESREAMTAFVEKRKPDFSQFD